MSEPFIEKTPSTLNENSEKVSATGLRESLIQENDVHIQSMQSGYGRNNQQQNRCQRTTDSQVSGPQNCQTPITQPCAPASCAPAPCAPPPCAPSPCAPPPCAPPPCTPSPCHEEQCVAYQAAMPYPLIKPQCKNPQYAAAILDNMAGQNSEMTAVSFYMYNQLIAGEYREIADTFYHINKVEMCHLQIFGNLAMQLGENPRLWSRKNRGGGYMYWSPAFLKYTPFPIPSPTAKDCSCPPPACQAVKLLLSQAIEGEKDAIKKYMQQTTWIQDINVCDNLRRISADEQMHLDILTRLYHKY